MKILLSILFFFLISKEQNILTKKGQAPGYTGGIQGAQQEKDKKEDNCYLLLVREDENSSLDPSMSIIVICVWASKEF